MGILILTVFVQTPENGRIGMFWNLLIFYNENMYFLLALECAKRAWIYSLTTVGICPICSLRTMTLWGISGHTNFCRIYPETSVNYLERNLVTIRSCSQRRLKQFIHFFKFFMGKLLKPSLATWSDGGQIMFFQLQESFLTL